MNPSPTFRRMFVGTAITLILVVTVLTGWSLWRIWQRDRHFTALHVVRRQSFAIAPVVSIAEFTQNGLVPDSAKPVAGQISHLAIDAAGPTYYGIGSHELHSIDSKTGSLAIIPQDSSLVKLSWPCGITFDSRRRRVVVATLGGEGFLYSFEPGTRRWQVIASLNSIDLVAILYWPEQDVFFGLAIDRGNGRQVGSLHTFNDAGALLQTVRLSTPLPGDRWPDDITQLVRYRGKILLLHTPKSTAALSSGVGDMETRWYWLEHRTGELVPYRPELF